MFCFTGKRFFYGTIRQAFQGDQETLYCCEFVRISVCDHGTFYEQRSPTVKLNPHNLEIFKFAHNLTTSFGYKHGKKWLISGNVDKTELKDIVLPTLLIVVKNTIHHYFSRFKLSDIVVLVTFRSTNYCYR